MRILIVEDQEKLANSLKKGLENIGYAVDTVHDGASGYRRILASPDSFDIIVSDIMMPIMNGIDMCRSIRKENINIPILLLTAKDTVEEKVEGLDTGADDYLVKPFEFEELAARVRALLRRPKDALSTELFAAGITLNTVTHIVTKNNKEIKLTLKEFVILELFMRNQNILLSRDKIIAHAWDYNYDTFSNVVDVHIKNLRRKLQNKNENIFETVHGAGYRFNA